MLQFLASRCNCSGNWFHTDWLLPILLDAPESCICLFPISEFQACGIESLTIKNSMFYDRLGLLHSNTVPNSSGHVQFSLNRTG
jgi:hypothetical protein